MVKHHTISPPWSICFPWKKARIIWVRPCAPVRTPFWSVVMEKPFPAMAWWHRVWDPHHNRILIWNVGGSSEFKVGHMTTRWLISHEKDPMNPWVPLDIPGFFFCIPSCRRNRLRPMPLNGLNLWRSHERYRFGPPCWTTSNQSR